MQLAWHVQGNVNLSVFEPWSDDEGITVNQYNPNGIFGSLVETSTYFCPETYIIPCDTEAWTSPEFKDYPK